MSEVKIPFTVSFSRKVKSKGDVEIQLIAKVPLEAIEEELDGVEDEEQIFEKLTDLVSEVLDDAIEIEFDEDKVLDIIETALGQEELEDDD